MVQGTHTHWRMTINNYDATDLALVQQGYPDHIRQIVYTLEEGEEGTPHIQAFIKMKRDCRMSHMKKLFPRGNFGAMDSSEWKLNQQRYAQKLDSTAKSPAVITNWDPLMTIEGVMKEVLLAIKRDMDYEEYSNKLLDWMRSRMEKRFVERDYKYAKVFVSATYKAMWRDFGPAMYSNIVIQQREQEEAHVEIPTTHTHTHTDENFSVAEDITDASSTISQDTEAEESEGDEDSEAEETVGSDESGSSCSGEEDD